MIGSVRAASARAPTPSRRATIVGVATLIASLACIALITLTPAAESAPLPFWCLKCGARAGVDVLLNILMFAPIGAALGLLRVRARWAFVLIVCATVTIEALQYAVIVGRFASARDIIANTAGGMIAWRIVLARRSVMFPPPARALAFSVVAALVWLMSQLFTAWAMNVMAPPGPWWAQIKLHDLGFPEYFRGTVVRSSLGTVAIRYSDQLEEAEVVRAQLIAGAPMSAVVTGARPTAGAAPILLLAADDRLSEVAALAQTGTGAFFRVRTRAAVIGLRNPSLRLDDVFVPGSTGDTIAVTGRYADGQYRIAIERDGSRRERSLDASPSWLWALLLPIPHYSFGPEVHVLTGLWVFAALFLPGFWATQGAARYADRRPAEARALAIAPLLVAIIIGLGVIPVACHLPVSHWSEWIAACAGIAGGGLVGRHVRWRQAREAPMDARSA